jgi:SAM-dependent methyltransferase
MSDSQIRWLQSYVDLFSDNALSHIVRTANLAGILQALDDGQKQLDEIAERCELDKRALESFMPALVQTPLVEQYGEYFALSQVARMIPPGMADLGDSHWQHLGKFLRTGRALPEIPNLAATEEDYATAAMAQEWLQTPAAMSAAAALDIGRHRRGLRVLELGCASAVFSLTFAHRDPTSRFVLVDTESRIQLARRGADSLGIDERLEFIESDYLHYQPEAASFDLILLASVIHRHREADVERLIRVAARALRGNGELCIVDIFPGQDRGDRFRSIFQLELAMRTKQGQLHSVFLIQDWLRAAGFGDIQFTHLPAPPYLWGLLIAPKDYATPESD